MGKKNNHRGPRKRRRKKKNVISNVILIISILVFLFALFMLIRSLLPYYLGKSGYQKIQDIAIQDNADKDSKEPEAFSVDFEKLSKLNADTIGWIRFDEPSIINYPIVQGKDNSQYLTQSFTEDDNKLGTIFMNIYNHKDFTDRETVIYGHNMHYGGDMFTKLVKYEEKKFCDKYPYFYIYTPDGKVSTYQVYAAGNVADDSEIYGVEFEDDAAFQQRIDYIRSSALYAVDADVTIENQIVVLSTCTNFASDQRFLVHGVKVKEEDVETE